MHVRSSSILAIYNRILSSVDLNNNDVGNPFILLHERARHQIACSFAKDTNGRKKWGRTRFTCDGAMFGWRVIKVFEHPPSGQLREFCQVSAQSTLGTRKSQKKVGTGGLPPVRAWEDAAWRPARL